jgi:hypothetical protein
MLRAGLQASLEERLVIDRKVDREADGRCGEYEQEYPTLPIVERSGRPKDQSDEEGEAEYGLDDGLPIQWIHGARLGWREKADSSLRSE